MGLDMEYILTCNIRDHALSPCLRVLIRLGQAGWTHLRAPVKAGTDLHKSYGFMYDIKFLCEFLKSALIEIAHSPYVSYAIHRNKEMYAV